MLGVLAAQVNKFDVAVQLIQRAVTLQPANPACYGNLANALWRAGRLDEAAACCRQALALNPNFAPAHNTLGTVLCQQGQFDEAIACCQRAVELWPGFVEAHNILGMALVGAGRLDEAIAWYQRALALREDNAEVHHNLGNVYQQKERRAEALPHFQRALALRPDLAEAHNNLGTALLGLTRLDEAAESLRRALALRPDYADAHSNLGAVLHAQGRPDDALVELRRAIELNPRSSEAHRNLGVVLSDHGQLDAAIACFEQALELNANFADAHRHADDSQAPFAPIAIHRPINDEATARMNLANTLLLKGDYARGWVEYEWRWRYREFPTAPRGFGQPLWTGEDLPDRTILLHLEQGYGDMFQMLRYVPLVARRFRTVILECTTELLRLLQASFPSPQIQIVLHGQPLPAFDVHCPMMSLPRAFGTTLESVPHDVPYLAAAQDQTRYWREWLSRQGGSLSVGLVWAGRAAHPNDRNRSLSLSAFAPLAEVPVSASAVCRRAPLRRSWPPRPHKCVSWIPRRSSTTSPTPPA